MNMSELKFLKKIISPFYLPFYWIIQLLNNLLLKKFYYYPDQETFVPDKSKSFFDYFNNNVIIKQKTKAINVERDGNFFIVNCSDNKSIITKKIIITLIKVILTLLTIIRL